MQSKHAIVVDEHGYKIEFVLVNFEEESGEIKEHPMYYTMQEGESLVYQGISEALSMFRPRWNGSMWEETATPGEIEAARPEPIPVKPSDMDTILLAIAEIYEKISGGAA